MHALITPGKASRCDLSWYPGDVGPCWTKPATLFELKWAVRESERKSKREERAERGRGSCAPLLFALTLSSVLERASSGRGPWSLPGAGGERGGCITEASVSRGVAGKAASQKGETSHILRLTPLLLCCTRPHTARHAAGTHHNHPHTHTHTDLHHLLAIQSLWSL